MRLRPKINVQGSTNTIGKNCIEQRPLVYSINSVRLDPGAKQLVKQVTVIQISIPILCVILLATVLALES